jgi:predicted MPP superfamily phosphohydrolase
LRLFIAFFFLVYGLMHVYAFSKARTALSLSFASGICLAAFMLVMILAPFIINISERQGYELFARGMSYVGYLWMGGLLLFITASLLFDMYRLLVHASAYILKKDLAVMVFPAGYSFFIPLLLSIAISFYGYFEAKNIHTEHLIVRTSKLPDNISRFRIVQISDVHLGLIVREERLKNIVRIIKEAKPDMLISTGDLVDGQMNKLEGLAEMLQDIKPEYGKFAVTGNHEFYAGLGQALSFTKKAGFKMLRGKEVSIDGIINIAGVDDSTFYAAGLSEKVSEKGLLAGLDHNKFTLFLKHRPIIDDDSIGLFDLQLSGHTHKGQIFPFSIVTKMFFPHQSGMFNLLKNSILYVSRGTGTWGPPIRFLSPPEVTVVDLVNQRS